MASCAFELDLCGLHVEAGVASIATAGDRSATKALGDGFATADNGTGPAMKDSMYNIPARLEPFGQIGWTLFAFSTAAAAVEFVRAHPDAAMPCWRRWEGLSDAALASRLESLCARRAS